MPKKKLLLNNKSSDEQGMCVVKPYKNRLFIKSIECNKSLQGNKSRMTM